MRLDQIAETDLLVQCADCAVERAVPFVVLLERFGRAARLSELLSSATCPRCGATGARLLKTSEVQKG